VKGRDVNGECRRGAGAQSPEGVVTGDVDEEGGGVNCAMDPPGKRACYIRLARRGQDPKDLLAVSQLISLPRLARRM